VRYLSLFSGMEAAHLAWAPLGWQCAGVAEIEPAACSLLRHRLPHVPNLGDVSAVDEARIASLGHIDVVIGGSPCQDLSVAGKRAGLAGARSSLFHQQLRIFNAARTLCGARWLVWENVPGAFSSNAGRDFAVVVGAMAGCRVDVPADGWGNEGVALGEHGLVEWAVLDAQWFGVAQRRRRVFAVLDTGDWTGRSPVLLEPDRLRGDSAPRRETRKGLAGAIGGGPDGGRISGAVTSKWAKGSGGPAGDECYNMVAHTLRADGFDASEDGTGRGTPLVPVPFTVRGTNLDTGDAVFGTLTTGSDRATSGAPCVAFDCKAGGETALSIGEVPGTLRAAHGGGHAAVAGRMGVRRLTPRECERLQGAPDAWTLVPKLGKPRKQRKNEPDAHYVAYLARHSGGVDEGPMMADGPRYKMLGNSFAVPVIGWIGRQIERASRADQKQAAA